MSQYDVRLADDVDARGVRRPDAAARLLLPVADALVVIHARGGAHGAVSPHAVAIDGDGAGTLVERSQLSPDPVFMAPTRHPGTGSPAADDVWAFAAVLTYAITGQPPRSGRHPARYTGWLAPLTELALLTEPESRPSMAEVADYLRARVAPPPETARRGRPSSTALALVGAGVIAVLGLLGTLLLFAGSDEDDRAADPARATSDTPTTETTHEPSDNQATESESDEPRTAKDLEDFARKYVRTASRDPEAGFALLSEDYQAASPRYREVWTAISDPKVLSVSADVDTFSVTYTYRYSLPDGDQRTEEVTLHLVERDDELLIATASSQPR